MNCIRPQNVAKKNKVKNKNKCIQREAWYIKGTNEFTEHFGEKLLVREMCLKPQSTDEAIAHLKLDAGTQTGRKDVATQTGRKDVATQTGRKDVATQTGREDVATQIGGLNKIDLNMPPARVRPEKPGVLPRTPALPTQGDTASSSAPVPAQASIEKWSQVNEYDKPISIKMPQEYGRIRDLVRHVSSEFRKIYINNYRFEFNEIEYQDVISDIVWRKMTNTPEAEGIFKTVRMSTPSKDTAFEEEDAAYLNIHREHIIPYDLIKRFVSELHKVDMSASHLGEVRDARDKWYDTAIDTMAGFAHSHPSTAVSFYGDINNYKQKVAFAKDITKKLDNDSLTKFIEACKQNFDETVECTSHPETLPESISSGDPNVGAESTRELEELTPMEQDLEKMKRISMSADDLVLILINSVGWMPGNIFFAWVGSNLKSKIAKARLNDEHKGLFFDTYYARVLNTLTEISYDRLEVSYAEYREAYRGMLKFNAKKFVADELKRTLEILAKIANIKSPLSTKSGSAATKDGAVSGGNWNMDGEASYIVPILPNPD